MTSLCRSELTLGQALSPISDICVFADLQYDRCDPVGEGQGLRVSNGVNGGTFPVVTCQLEHKGERGDKL